MTGRTHVMLGMAAVTAVVPKVPELDIVQAVFSGDFQSVIRVLFPLLAQLAAAWVGSLVPDLDKPGSTMAREVAGPFGKNRLFALLGGILFLYVGAFSHPAFLTYKTLGIVSLIGIALVVMAFIKHRGITHSILGLAIAVFVFQAAEHTEVYRQFVNYNLVLPFAVGYATHLLADACTESGIAPVYIPYVVKTHKRFRIPVYIRTGSFMDTVIIRLGAFALLAFMVIERFSG